jgi:Uma2 family endonuclease
MVDAEKVKLTVADYRAIVPEDHDGIVELIDGEIYTTVAKTSHQVKQSRIYRWLVALLNDEVVLHAPVNVYFDDENYVEPDIFYVGGADAHCKLGDDGFWYGAPALIVEVLSESTARRDRIDKFLLYEKHGVREYWIVEPTRLIVEVYTLENGEYRQHGVYTMGDTFTSPLLGAAFDMNVLLGS